MIKNIFPHFPDTSRIWIYGFKNHLSDKDLHIVNHSLDQFIKSWKSHGRDVDGDYQIVENRFIVFAVSEKDTVSGCSIDSSIRTLENLRNSFGLDALDQNIVFFRQDDRIGTAMRNQFIQMVTSGQIDEEIFVYDLSIQNLGSLRCGEFEKQYKNSWAAVAFPVST